MSFASFKDLFTIELNHRLYILKAYSQFKEMFKIPSYSDLEKREKESNAKVNELKLNLFKQKQNITDDTYKPTTSTGTSTSFNSIAVSNVEPSKSIAQPMTSKPIVPPADDDDDDDAFLLDIDIDAITASKKAQSVEAPPVIQKPTTSLPQTTRPMPAKPNDNENVFKKPRLNEFIPSNSVGSSASTSTNGLIINAKQRGNPILKYIRNVQWYYSDTLTPDFSMSRSSCALYLSMKYHLLNNEYIHDRLRELGRAYELRVLLVQVDIKETKHCLKELEKICVLANLTLILCWSHEEAGRYLETYKAYEYKSADLIMEKSVPQATTSTSNHTDVNFMTNYTDFLCSIKSINKTDASTLRQTFGSIKDLSQAEKHELSVCPGLGPLKVNRLYDIFRTPFLLNTKDNRI